MTALRQFHGKTANPKRQQARAKSQPIFWPNSGPTLLTGPQPMCPPSAPHLPPLKARSASSFGQRLTANSLVFSSTDQP